MIDNSKGYSVQPKVAIEFLGRFSPFKELGPTPIEEIVGELEVEFYPKGTLIFRREITEITHLHIIQKGSVKVFVRSESDTFVLKNVGGEGEILGGAWLRTSQKPDVTVEALEDTFCILLPRGIFLKLASEQPLFDKFFRDEFQKDRISNAYSETRNERIRTSGFKRFDYFTIHVSDIIRPNFQVVNSGSTIQQVARIMTQFNIGSVLVRDNSEKIVGIVTKKGLRSKVVARGLDYNLPVERIMSTPIRTIPVQARLFEAALRMVRERINHLPATQGNEIVGIVTKHDIMVHQAAAPVILLREIKYGGTPEAINSLTRNIPGMIRSLMEEGAKASHCTTVITLLHDGIFSRALDLIARFPDSGPFTPSFILLGRAARMEQTFVPVYDYLVVYTDDQRAFIGGRSETALENVTLKLNNFFYSCFGDTLRLKISAANPRWLQSIDVWSGYIDEWTSNPIPPEIAIAKNFLDMRTVPRENQISNTFRKMLFDRITSSKNFMRGLAEDFLNIAPPVSFFRNAIVEADGTQIHRLDLESRIAEPFADFARLMCFKYNIKETNTLKRLKSLADIGAIRKDICSEALEAYEFQNQLVLMNQLRALNANTIPGYVIDPTDLTELEKRILKETFAVINRLQMIVKEKFL
ncbi:MAG: putative nucleotidyltransferase substrate binding domain-containing protein [Desulfomonilaceae bacterium]